jgi:hypothetical protein
MSALLLRPEGVDVVEPRPFVLVAGATYAIRGPLGLWREYAALRNVWLSDKQGPVQPTVFHRTDQAEAIASDLLRAGVVDFAGAGVLHVVRVILGPGGRWIEPSPAVVVSTVELVGGAVAVTGQDGAA